MRCDVVEIDAGIFECFFRNALMPLSSQFTITVLNRMLAYPKHLLVKTFGVADNVARSSIKNLNVDKR